MPLKPSKLLPISSRPAGSGAATGKQDLHAVLYAGRRSNEAPRGEAFLRIVELRRGSRRDAGATIQ